MWQQVFQRKSIRNVLANEAITWAVCNGLVVSSILYKKKTDCREITESYTHAPFTLLPSLQMTKKELLHLKSLSFIYHKLIDAISRDSNFLIKILEPAAKSDAHFLGKLLNIYKTVLLNGIKQKYYFGIFRNDFMKQQETLQNESKWIQIEINTIASAGGLISDKTSKLHSYLIKKYKLSNNNYNIYPEDNENNLNLAKSIFIASEIVHCDYMNGKYKDIEDRTMLMIVSDDEVNISDQKGLEYVLLNKYNIITLRRSLLYIYKNGKLNIETGELYIDDMFISIIYFRNGYAPNHYKSDKEWNARLMIEESLCIKCPNIEYQLIGSKLMQIIFCNKNILQKYLNYKEIETISQHFGELKLLKNVLNDKELLNKIKNNPKYYVLKHIQREGGGNNLYGDDIVDFIDNKMDNKNINHWIIMDRIYPKPTKTIQIKNSKQIEINGISEFGVYSSYISNGKQGNIKCNDIIGTLVRTKPMDIGQGGVFSGFAVFDSVITLNNNHHHIIKARL